MCSESVVLFVHERERERGERESEGLCLNFESNLLQKTATTSTIQINIRGNKTGKTVNNI